jgi:hypothetical protein
VDHPLVYGVGPLHEVACRTALDHVVGDVPLVVFDAVQTKTLLDLAAAVVTGGVPELAEVFGVVEPPLDPPFA